MGPNRWYTDTNFINKLSTRNQNVFKTIWDEIKYLCKVATAGSKEARELARVQKVFEDAYRQGGKVEGKQYALSQNARDDVHKALYDRKYEGDVKLTDNSPSILSFQKGVKDLPMVMKSSHIRENVFTEEEALANGLKVNQYINYHGIGEDLFLKVIDELDGVKEAYRGTKNADDPTRSENYFLLISQQTDKEGNTINVPVYINEKGQYNRGFIDTNKIATVFGRSELRKYINEQIAKGNLVRVKNKSTQSSEATSPINADFGKSASIDANVPQTEPTVKHQYSMTDSEGVQLTKKQQEFFKDSKMRDENSSLKVMYRGGNNDFTMFDHKKSSCSNLYGKGFYFTDSKSHAKQCGDTRAFYLDIKNPVPTAEIS